MWVCSAAADPIALHSTPVAFSEEEASGPRIVGKLEYLGGLHLTSSDARFGGWSGLIARADGTELVAISDHGYSLRFHPRYNAAGWLVGVASWGEIASLQDPTGKPVSNRRRDAEDVAALPDGIAVSFEGDHRIWLYPHGGGPLALPPRVLDRPLGLMRAPPNKGIEALAGLRDGRLLVLTEGLSAGKGLLQGWIGKGPPHDAWAPLTWRTVGEFVPSGAATLPNGDVLVLERRFSWVGGLASRLVHVALRDIRAHAVLSGQEIARLEVPVVHENFEGVAVAARDGKTLVYLVSDDNYNAVLQRTLLLMFAFAP